MTMSHRRSATATLTFLLLLGAGLAQGPAAQQRPPAFRANVVVVSVDVIVRDRQGNIIRTLTEKDFEIREDGQAQAIRTFAFQEISDAAPPAATATAFSGRNSRNSE